MKDISFAPVYNKSMKLFLLILLLPFFTACTTLSTKVEEARLVNESAAAKGYVKSPKEAFTKGAAKCVTSEKFKWELKFDANSPLIEQSRDNQDPAYGAYQLICFKLDSSATRELRVATKHTGGGYSKAYYVLPALYAFFGGKPLELSRSFQMKQNPWSGDYVFTLPFPAKGKGDYAIVVEANNRYPTKPWTEYANPGLGWAIQGLFPVNVISSTFGEVTVELLSPDAKK